MKNSIKLYHYSWKHLKKYKFSFFAATVLFGLMVFIGDVITPLYIKKLTDLLVLGELGHATTAMLVLLMLYIAMRLSLFISMRLTSWFEARVSRDIYQESFEHFTKHSYHFYTNEFTGSLVEKSGRLGQNFVYIIDNLLFSFFSLAVTLGGTLVVLYLEDSSIGISFSIFLVTYVALTFWMNKKISPYMEKKSQARSSFKGVVSDIIMNIQTVLFFGHRKGDLNQFKEENEKMMTTQYQSWLVAINYELGIGFLAPLFTIGVTFYALHLFGLGVVSIGSVILVFMLASNVSGQVWRLSGASRRLITDISDCVEAIDIIEREVEVQDLIHAQALDIQQGNIEFKEVDFTYPEGEEVLQKFNLNITGGQSIGIVGKSGSGKTTLTKLILRLYDVDGGRILIDGQDISKVTQEDLRKNIAYVPQETVLFHRSIRENIHYASPDAEPHEIMEASKAAHVDEFVSALEEGYETKVGERGIKLSGGQRQRIGIARAMLKKHARILVMDEATSSLDTISEQYIQGSFSVLSKNRTTVVIAHRLSTIQKMDRIIVMEKGSIVEDGTHQELIHKNGQYAELWNSQVDGFIQE